MGRFRVVPDEGLEPPTFGLQMLGRWPTSDTHRQSVTSERVTKTDNCCTTVYQAPSLSLCFL